MQQASAVLRLALCTEAIEDWSDLQFPCSGVADSIGMLQNSLEQLFLKDFIEMIHLVIILYKLWLMRGNDIAWDSW